MSAEEESTEEAEPRGEVDQIRLFKTVVATSSRPQLEVPMYDGSLNAEELVNCINTIDKYFDYEEVDEAKKVNFSMMKLQGHTSTWWDGVQADKRSKGKKKIKIWRKMLKNLKAKFLPKDYQLSLFKKCRI